MNSKLNILFTLSVVIMLIAFGCDSVNSPNSSENLLTAEVEAASESQTEQCTAKATLNLDEGPDEGEENNAMFVTAVSLDGSTVSNGGNFNLFSSGDVPATAANTGNGEVRIERSLNGFSLYFRGAPEGIYQFRGTIQLNDVNLSNYSTSTISGAPLEDGSGGGFADVVEINESTSEIYFDLRVGVGDDSFVIEGLEKECDAPAVPTGLGWTDSNGDAVLDGGTTNLENGIASWDENTEEDFSHYIYKYWNDIESSSYNDEASAWTVNNGDSNSRSGSFNQGEGTHYFCIVAVDDDGNKSDCSKPFTVIYNNSPETKEDCWDEGYLDYNFDNQGLCIQYVNTGIDSRDDE